MKESWQSQSSGLGSLSLEKSTLFFLPLLVSLAPLSLSLSQLALSRFLSRSTNSLLPEAATVIPSNCSQRPSLKLTEVTKDGFS
jgi:hypothetical protein